MHRRSFLALLSATAAGSALTACSTGSTDADTADTPSPSAGGSASKGAFPVTIKHAFGSTTIKQKPTRIATLGWSDGDVILSLGEVPIGVPQITWGGNAKKSTDPFDAALAKVGGKAPTRYSDADGAPIDEIARLNPDFISAANSGLTKEEYVKLSKIAPVLAYPGEAWGTSWQDAVRLIGQALGLSEKATSVTKATEKTIADALTKYPAIKGKTVAWAIFNPANLSTFNVYTALDNRPKMLVDDLGMKNAPRIEALSKTTKSFNAAISGEKASTLDAEVLVFYIDKPGQDKTFKANPLLGKIPAMKSGAYVASLDPIESYFMSAPSPLTIPDGLPRFLPKLAAAAGKAS